MRGLHFRTTMEAECFATPVSLTMTISSWNPNGRMEVISLIKFKWGWRPVWADFLRIAGITHFRGSVSSISGFESYMHLPRTFICRQVSLRSGRSGEIVHFRTKDIAITTRSCSTISLKPSLVACFSGNIHSHQRANPSFMPLFRFLPKRGQAQLRLIYCYCHYPTQFEAIRPDECECIVNIVLMNNYRSIVWVFHGWAPCRRRLHTVFQDSVCETRSKLTDSVFSFYVRDYKDASRTPQFLTMRKSFGTYKRWVMMFVMHQGPTRTFH